MAVSTATIISKPARATIIGTARRTVRFKWVAKFIDGPAISALPGVSAGILRVDIAPETSRSEAPG